MIQNRGYLVELKYSPTRKGKSARYAESVTEYQLRRIAQFIVESREKHMEIKRWSLFRNVGLSDQRITPDTMKILDSLTYL